MKHITAYICMLCLSASFLLSGCDSEGDASDKTGTDAEAADAAPVDEYDQYIRNTLSSLDQNGNAAASDTNGNNAANATPAISPDDKVVTTDRTAPNDTYYSSMENPDSEHWSLPTKTPTLTPTPTVAPGDTSATDTDGSTEGEEEPYITPDDFPVGKCCIYINGESDSAYGNEIVTAINKARKDLGYDEFAKNTGLATCADRRTREIAANYSHTRPNGLMFYSLAPDYFIAEMLIIDNQKAENTVDDIIKRDPISRNLIFTNKYKSIGASSFKCNGMKFTVVAFGI